MCSKVSHDDLRSENTGPSARGLPFTRGLYGESGAPPSMISDRRSGGLEHHNDGWRRGQSFDVAAGLASKRNDSARLVKWPSSFHFTSPTSSPFNTAYLIPNPPARVLRFTLSPCPELAAMPFTSPSWVPQLPEIPDTISIERFMFDERYGRFPLGYSRPLFTCALSGRSYSALEVKERVDHLSRALCKEFGFKPNEGSEWDKVIAVFSLNAIDYLTLGWAVHRIGGILTCVNAAYSPSELEYQMNDSGAKAIFTCLPLLQTCKDGVKKSKLPNDKIYVLPLADQATGGMKNPGHKTIEDLIQAGSKLTPIKPSDESWSQGDGKKKCAFLCYSSGTSGLPKGKVEECISKD